MIQAHWDLWKQPNIIFWPLTSPIALSSSRSHLAHLGSFWGSNAVNPAKCSGIANELVISWIRSDVNNLTTFETNFSIEKGWTGSSAANTLLCRCNLLELSNLAKFEFGRQVPEFPLTCSLIHRLYWTVLKCWIGRFEGMLSKLYQTFQ